MRSVKKMNEIHIRFADEDYELLVDEARKRNLTIPQTAKKLLLEIICGFDQKQESFLRRLDKQDEQIELLLELTSIAAAASALPLDSDNHDQDQLREKLKIHFKKSKTLGTSLVNLLRKGTL